MADCNFSPRYPFADSFIFGKNQYPLNCACRALFLRIYCVVFLWLEGNPYVHGQTVPIHSHLPVKQPLLCCFVGAAGGWQGIGYGERVCVLTGAMTG